MARFRARLPRLLPIPIVLFLVTCVSDPSLSPDRQHSLHVLDTGPPTVAITAPTAGTAITIPTTISADASDDELLAGVEFLAGGIGIGPEDDTAPYEIVLNTDTLPSGVIDLTAIARDAAGNTTVSAAVAVTIFHPDTTPPTVTITAPADGATLSAPATVTADANDDWLLAGVQFRLNQVDLGAEDLVAPYEADLNTDTLPSGPMELTAVARDTAGNTMISAIVHLTILHPDVIPPTVTITAPIDGAVITAPTQVTADASDDGPLAGVQFKLNGLDLGAEDPAAPYGTQLNTDTLIDGSFELTALARDTANNSTLSAIVRITVVHPDITPPSVAITAPVNGGIVSAPVTITAAASDNKMMAGVLFKLNGADLGIEDDAPPYEAQLNTNVLPDGYVDLTALARDTAGNTALSAVVRVLVFHPDVTPPTVAIASPLAGSTISGVVTIAADASDDYQVGGVQFLVNGATLGAEDLVAPYSASLTTTSYPNGPITLTAVARDTAGHTTLSAAVQVTNSNLIVRIPLNDLGAGSYYGFGGGLFPTGSNLDPSGHEATGRLAATSVVRRSKTGNTAATGKYILLSIGFSNAAQEWCGVVTTTKLPACTAWSFTRKAATDTAVITVAQGLVVFDGAMGGQGIDAWDQTTDPNYNVIKTRLGSKGYSEKQVEIVWLKIAHTFPTVSLPSPNADAYRLVIDAANTVRALRVRYPNLQQVFISPRIYAGYAASKLNPEPYAYESGFAVKWLVAAQIQQLQTGAIDPLAGDLGPTVAPWIGWGAYMWADGTHPRSDQLQWVRADFETDGTHPSKSGEQKVAGMLMVFFKTSPFSACWFIHGGHC